MSAHPHGMKISLIMHQRNKIYGQGGGYFISQNTILPFKHIKEERQKEQVQTSWI